jgi:cytochrome c oxidase subunit III
VAAGIDQVDPFHLPLINTLVLLLSGCFATWAHHAIVHDDDRKTMCERGLLIGAVALGVAVHHHCRPTSTRYAAFTQDWTFGGINGFSNFFMATGFHGLHVIIGTIFLFVCYLRVRAGHFTAEKHVGFEAAAWYWHFVDVVWLFLFFAVYIWGIG